MKYLLILTSLFVLVSCNSKSSSKSRSCTYNNEPIDCAYMDGVSDGSDTIPTSSPSLFSEVNTRIILFSNHFEMTATAKNFKKETVNGKVRYCETQVSASDIFWFYFNDNDLVMRLNDENGTFRYKRVGEETGQIFGVWTRSEKASDHTRITTLRFLEGNLKVSTECKFN